MGIDNFDSELFPKNQSKDTQNLLDALGALGFGRIGTESAQRVAAIEALEALTGLSSGDFEFESISSTKYLHDQLDKALANSPPILVFVCPELFEDRITEELDRLGTSFRPVLVLVLCGEETSFHVSGPDEELVSRIRSSLEPPCIETVCAPKEPSRILFQNEPADWRSWNYSAWNRQLVAYCLGADGLDDEPVERLAATPEELVLVSGGDAGEIDEISRAFVDACLSNIPRGTSFFGYCGSARGRRRATELVWSPDSEEPPYFFAMLWFTCLVVYGYPDTEGGFYERFFKLLGNADHLQGLPDLWIEVWEWTEKRSEAGDLIRILHLPFRDDFRSTIGESHYLAFPHKHDRRQIARVLVEADLVGFEPPITPVVSRLLAERTLFSKLFGEDLDHFVHNFVLGERDPVESPFWRAVRHEALQPSYSGSRRPIRGRTTTILGAYDDEGFLPLLGCATTWSPPPGYTIKPFENPVGGFEYYAEADVGGLDAVHKVMFGSIGLLGPGPRALINQGVLVFQEDQSGDFFIVSGHDANGADVALVRDDLVAAFVQEYGGTSESARVSGWSHVEGCAVKQLESLPEGLEGVVQLLRTMCPPTIRFVGGIQVPGGYLGIRGLLPKVRAPEAIEILLTAANREFICQPNGEGEWTIPDGISELLPARCNVLGRWQYGRTSVRTSERRLNLEVATVDDSYRTLAGGSYFMESCCPGQKAIEGNQSIPLLITTGDSAKSLDLLNYEPSVRYLGPGLGELSLEPKDGFDWIAVGYKKSPELLIFVGDTNIPTAPAARRSTAAGDRSHWRTAFGKAASVWVRLSGGTYHRIEEFPHLDALRHQMKRHDPGPDAQVCETTRLQTVSMEPPRRTPPCSTTLSMVDALTALSARRSGLQYRTVQQVFEELTGVRDYLLHHELIRAWTDCGAFDILRSQTYSSTRLVARIPRFVAVRRGPLLEVSLIGLVTQAKTAQIHRIARELRLPVSELQPGCPWQPTVLRIRASESELNEITLEAELAPMEWLTWNEEDEVPRHLCVDLSNQDLWADSPPAGFSIAKCWDWQRGEFRRSAACTSDRIVIEQRVRHDSCSIYVVFVDSIPRLWTYVRNWALLFAHVEAGKAPFVVDRSGWISTTGRSPVHLPLPLGRLCAVLGEGLSGPLLDVGTKRVEGYCYPFGSRVTELVSRVIPTTWLEEGD